MVGRKTATHHRARPVAWCVDGLANQTATCTTVCATENVDAGASG
jgi:hypothetical protein